MEEPQWITLDTVLAIHAIQLAEHGGQDGIRDMGLLESALHRPKSIWKYGNRDISAVATAYAFGIAKNHPFLDGNKRSAGVACETFLIINGSPISVSTDEWYISIFAIAAGDYSEEQFAHWIRDHLKEIDSGKS